MYLVEVVCVCVSITSSTLPQCAPSYTLERIQKAEVRLEPYPHVYLQHYFTPKLYSCLLQQLPSSTAGYKQFQDKVKDWKGNPNAATKMQVRTLRQAHSSYDDPPYTLLLLHVTLLLLLLLLLFRMTMTTIMLQLYDYGNVYDGGWQRTDGRHLATERYSYVLHRKAPANKHARGINGTFWSNFAQTFADTVGQLLLSCMNNSLQASGELEPVQDYCGPPHPRWSMSCILC